MTNEQLEAVIARTHGETRATAYAALTLAKLLEPQWTHRVTVRELGQPPRQVEVVRAAGIMVGERSELRARFEKLVSELLPNAFEGA